jgi:hypothetical protein
MNDEHSFDFYERLELLKLAQAILLQKPGGYNVDDVVSNARQLLEFASEKSPS